MKNLDLATYGVVELNEVEMMEIDGGSKVICAIAKAAKAVGQFIKTFAAAVEEAFNCNC